MGGGEGEGWAMGEGGGVGGGPTERVREGREEGRWLGGPLTRKTITPPPWMRHEEYIKCLVRMGLIFGWSKPKMIKFEFG